MLSPAHVRCLSQRLTLQVYRYWVSRHTKSNAAILRLLCAARGVTGDAAYRPTSRLSLTMRHVILSGSFLDKGVKKLATALPTSAINMVHHSLCMDGLVVVDCCFRFDGGGETPLSFELGRFSRLGLSTMLDSSISQGYDVRKGVMGVD